MTLRASKPAFNVREKLTELGRRFGLKGSELVAAETVQEARDLVSAGRKNLVINGDMRISQRYGFNNPQTVTNQNDYYLDRFVLRENTSGAFQVRQSTPGYPFEASMQINVTTADTSISSSEYARIQYYVEGNDARAIDWGKSGSKDHLTLSFWVRSNAPGDYHVSIENSNNNYFPIMVKKYTIEQPNVWQKVVVTFPPPGVYNFHRGEGIGLRITWSLVIGSSYNSATDGVWFTSPYLMSTSAQRNFMDTVGNNFHMTGGQLERGRNATEFEHRSYGEELALCQRYYLKTSNAFGTVYESSGNTGNVGLGICFPVEMRVAATNTITSLPTGTANNVHNFGAGNNSYVAGGTYNGTTRGCQIYLTGGTAKTVGTFSVLNIGAEVSFNAEW